MSSYSIKHLELISGIKAHTIRMWERRYNVLLPQRTDTNIRRYTESDVRLILNIVLLLHNGYKISKVATKSQDEISELILQISPNTSPSKDHDLEPLLLSLLSFDQSAFKAYLKTKIADHGLEKTYEGLILPLFYRIGILWQTGMIKPTHEHFATNIVKHILISNFEAIQEPKSDAPLFLFFLPEGEYHELGLLFYAFAAKKMGFRTIYLGQSTPTDDVIQAAKEIRPAVIFTSTSSSISEINLADFYKTIHKSIPNGHLFVTGYKINQDRFKIPKEISIISTIESFSSKVKSIKLK
jgi:DNA-binding transcriptional MerR regulator/methylmalonyl-CoA mutase cobalamin-binding subunit